MAVVKVLVFALLVASCIAYEIRPRIFKGTAAKRAQFPFFAFLDVEVEDGQQYMCGASLISDRWIITAAHCMDDSVEISVRLGYLNLFRDENVVIYKVSKDNMFPHPDYDVKKTHDDIGLLQLPNSVRFTDAIVPIKISSRRYLFEYTDITLIGNGAVKGKGGRSSETIEFTKLKTLPSFECRDVYDLSFSQVCANSDDGASGCVGDSGGPVILPDGTLVGVAATCHQDGCDQGFPQTFTNIGIYHPWIQNVTGIDLGPSLGQKK